MIGDATREALERELAYHEKLYSGFAQQHFAKAAVRAFRAHIVTRILNVAPVNRDSRVLSLGCGIGDTELLLASHVGEVVGVDLSPKAVEQARADARKLGIRNAHFIQGSIEREIGEFDLVIAIFFLHHLPDVLLDETPKRIRERLSEGGTFYSLDPNRYRLSGLIGSLLIPSLMKKYQTQDERELIPNETAARFQKSGFDTRVDYYDFLSSPMAGLFPSWRFGYQATRAADELLRRTPGLQKLGSNFEVIARMI